MGGQHSRDHDHQLHLVSPADAAGPSSVPAVDLTDRSIISRITMNRGSRRSSNSYPYPRTHTTVMVIPNGRTPVVDLQQEPQPFVRPPLNRAIPTIHESRSNESIKTQMSTSESRHSVVAELIPPKTIVEGEEPMSSTSLVIENRLAHSLLDNRPSSIKVVEATRVTPRSEPRSPLMTVAHSVRSRLSKFGSRFSRSHDTTSGGTGSGLSSKSGSTRSLSSSAQLKRRASSVDRRRPDVNANFESKLFKSSSMEVAMNNPIASSPTTTPHNQSNHYQSNHSPISYLHLQRPLSRPPAPPAAAATVVVAFPGVNPSTITATLSNNNSCDVSSPSVPIMTAAVDTETALKEAKPVAAHKPSALPKPSKATKQRAEETKKNEKVTSLIPKAISSSSSSSTTAASVITSKPARPKNIAPVVGMAGAQKLPRYPPRCAPLAESESSTVENSPAVELAPSAFPANQAPESQPSAPHPTRKCKIPSPGQRRKVLPIGKSPLAAENEKNSTLTKKKQTSPQLDRRLSATSTTMIIPYSSSRTAPINTNADPAPGAIERLAMDLSRQSAYAQSRLRSTTAQLYATRSRQVYSPNGIVSGGDKTAVAGAHGADTHELEAAAAAAAIAAPVVIHSTLTPATSQHVDDASSTNISSLTTSSCALTTGSTSVSSKPTSPATSDGTRRGLIDDEIKDQPMLVGHRYSLENPEEAHDVIASLDPNKSRMQNMQTWRRSRTPRDSLASVGSLDGDEVIFDYESSMDEEQPSSSPYRAARYNSKPSIVRRDSSHSQRSSIKTPTGGSKRNSVDLEAAEAELCLLVDRISVESASLQVASNRRRSAGDGIDKEQQLSVESSSNAVVTVAPVGSSKLRPPSALSADASGLDCVAFPDPHTYAAACRDVIALKTQLHQLQTLLQSTQTANPFEAALMQASSSSSAEHSPATQRPPTAIPNGPTIPSEEKRKLDILIRENDLLKRQMFEKDRLIETLRRQISEQKAT